MNIKDFKPLSKTEYEALTEREQVKYELQYEQYKAEQQAQQARDAAKEVIEEMRKEYEDKLTNQFKELSESNEEAMKKLAEKYNADIDDLKAQMKRAKVAEVAERMKGMSEQIMEKLSTEEGEAMIKEFFAGQKQKLAVELDADALKAMGVPAGGVAPHFTPIVGPGHDEIHARTVIPVLPTVSNLIKFIQYTIDPSATGFGTVPVGGQKPDVGYIPTVKEAPIRKIAGLLDVPDELLDDVVGFRAWIAYELPKAYLDAEDMQIFKGDGTGENLLGLWYQAAFQPLPVGTVTTASNTIDKVAAGITTVRQRKRATSAVFVSPVEYMEMLINKGTTDEYTYPIIFDANGTMRVGGVPIYWSNVFEEGEGLVGDFSRGTTIFQRKAMNIGYFDQNKDNVEKNIVTIRLEGRIALPIYYPEAFLKLFQQTT